MFYFTLKNNLLKEVLAARFKEHVSDQFLRTVFHFKEQNCQCAINTNKENFIFSGVQQQNPVLFNSSYHQHTVTVV